MKKTFVLLAAVVIGFAGCDSLGQAVSSHTDVLARAAGHELTVDQAAAMVAPHREIPAQREVVEVVANLWVDYMLVATAAAQDSTLGNVNLASLLKPYGEQSVVWQLRSKVVQIDTAVSDEELRQRYEQEGTGLQVRARHILFRMAPDAPQSVRDSVQRLADQVRQRAVAGEDFAALARTYSQDGSAQQGGDLGFMGRGGWVAPFEEAAFKLQPGQISDIVETPFGLHIIKVEERRQTPFEEIRDSFRQNAQDEKVAKAEEAYIKGLTDTLKITVQEAAIENARELAKTPGADLRGRAGSRALVRYQGGSLTAAEFLDVVRGMNPQYRGQLLAAGDDQIRQVLEGITRNKVLVAEAERQGFAVSPQETDSLSQVMRLQLTGAARGAGLISIQPQDGETMRQATERKVSAFMDAILRGEQNAFPLGPVSFTLREQFGGEVFDRSFDAVVARIDAQRPARAEPTPAPVPPDTGAASGSGSDD
jgi:peptidyl-prolyl cis-trans isomerase C